MIERHGHFAVMSAKMSKWHHHQRVIALVEVTGEKTPTKIDPRQKAVKRIILRDTCSTRGKGDYVWQRLWSDYTTKAQRWDMIYPMHVFAKDWPLRSTQEGTI